jgi:hypothetical protein
VAGVTPGTTARNDDRNGSGERTQRDDASHLAHVSKYHSEHSRPQPGTAAPLSDIDPIVRTRPFVAPAALQRTLACRRIR